MSNTDIEEAQVFVLHSVCGSLLRDTGLDADVIAKVKFIAKHDPQFPLKLGVYVRDDLGLRKSGNAIFALAGQITQCRPFLKPYLRFGIRLPTDWLDVAKLSFELHQEGQAKLPASLRKALVDKFADFDEYQLGKYVGKGQTKTRDVCGSDDEDGRIPPKGIKQLVRALHITQPARFVMSVVGKKYPETKEDFEKAGLSGRFDARMAGKRMKLATPVTWETQVSANGNKPSTWEELIDQRKLPFMAMLRNLRNLILCKNEGISAAHHEQILGRLQSPDQVADSRQFPYRFLSAFDALALALPAVGDAKLHARIREYQEALETSLQLSAVYNLPPIHGSVMIFCDVSYSMSKPFTTAGPQNKRPGKKPSAPTSLLLRSDIALLLSLMCRHSCETSELYLFDSNTNLCQRFNPPKAREGNAILKDIRTLRKMKGISKGVHLQDVLLGPVRDRMPVSTVLVVSDGLFDPRAAGETSRLFSDFSQVMRKDLNEKLLYVSVAVLRGKNPPANGTPHPNDVMVTGYSDQILRFVAERAESQLSYVQRIDQIKGISVSSSSTKPSRRTHVLSYATAAVTAQAEAFRKRQREEEEAAKSAQPGPRDLMSDALTPVWRTVRVFISSTFLDFNGERDALVRRVFPQLRRLCARKRLHLVEVDFRWGITAADAKGELLLERCLDAVDACRPFFIGLVGHRYGRTPSYALPDGSRHRWVKDYPPGRSVTELEIYSGALARWARTRACVYIRDNYVAQTCPRQYLHVFAAEDKSCHEKAENLRSAVRDAAKDRRIIARSYTCSYGGVVAGRPSADVASARITNDATGELEEERVFLDTVRDDLWRQICAEFPDDDVETEESAALEEEAASDRTQTAMFAGACRNGVAREQVLNALWAFACDPEGSKVAVVQSRPSMGKSSVLAHLAAVVAHRASNNVFKGAPYVAPIYFTTGDSPILAPSELVLVGLNLCKSIHQATGCGISELKAIRTALAEGTATPFLVRDATQDVLDAACRVSPGPVVLLIDGLDGIKDGLEAAVRFLPHPPANCKIVLSSSSADFSALVRGRFGSATSDGTEPVGVHEIPLGTMSTSEASTLIEKQLLDYGKKLDKSAANNQMRMLQAKQEFGCPMYLRMVCEELRLVGVYEQLSEHLRGLPATLPSLTASILVRLEAEFGAEVVATLLGCLALARRGLSESSARDVLKHSLSAAASTGQGPRTATPQAGTSASAPAGLAYTWDRLNASLSGLLQRSGGGFLRIGFGILRNTVLKKYCSDQRMRAKCHSILADVLNAEVSIPWNLDAEVEGDVRSLPDICHHRVRAGDTVRVVGFLSDLRVVAAHFQGGLGAALLRSYDEAMEQVSSNKKDLATLQLFRAFTSENTPVLSRYPNLILQLAGNEPMKSPVREAATNFLRPETAFIEWSNRPSHGEVLGHAFHDVSATGIACMCMSPDGQRIATGADDWSVRVFAVDSGAEVARFRGHLNTVVHCAFSADGRCIISSSADHTARIWDSVTGASTELKGHRKQVSCAAFGPEGTYPSLVSADQAFSSSSCVAVTGSDDASVSLWYCSGGRDNDAEMEDAPKQVVIENLPAGTTENDIRKLMAELPGGVGTCGLVKVVLLKDFKRRGKQFAAVVYEESFDAREAYSALKAAKPKVHGIAVLLTLGQRKKVMKTDAVWQRVQVKQHSGPVACVAFCPWSTETFASGSWDWTVRVYTCEWEAQRGPCVTVMKTITGHTGAVLDVAFSPSFTMTVASASRDGTARVTQIESSETYVFGLPSADDESRHAPKRQRIAANKTTSATTATHSWARTRTMANTDSASSAADRMDEVEESSDKFGCTNDQWVSRHGTPMIHCTFAGGGDYLLTVSDEVALWRVSAIGQKQDVMTKVAGGYTAASLCKMTGHFAVASPVGGVRMFDLPDYAREKKGPGGGMHGSRRGSIKFTPLAGSSTSTSASSSSAMALGVVHVQRVNAVALSSNNSFVVSGSQDGALVVCQTGSAVSGKALSVKASRPLAHASAIMSVAVTSTDMVISAGADGYVKAWWLPSLEPIRNIIEPDPSRLVPEVYSTCAVSPCGGWVLVGSWSGQVSLLSLVKSDSEPIHVALPNHAPGLSRVVVHVAYEPSGTRAAVATRDGKVYVIDLSNGPFGYSDDKTRFIRTIGSGEWLSSIAFTADGSSLVAGSYDGTVRVVDLESSDVVHDFVRSDVDAREDPRENRVYALCCLADGDTVSAAYHNGSVALFSLQSKRMVAEFVCRSRCLSVSAAPQLPRRKPPPPLIACGDETGRIYVLRPCLPSPETLLASANAGEAPLGNPTHARIHPGTIPAKRKRVVGENIPHAKEQAPGGGVKMPVLGRGVGIANAAGAAKPAGMDPNTLQMALMMMQLGA
eukprot:Rmarinus@m.8896